MKKKEKNKVGEKEKKEEKKGISMLRGGRETERAGS